MANFTKVIDHSKNLENYSQQELYSTIVELRGIHGEMIGGFYNNLDKNLNNTETKLELSFLDSMIDTTRKVLQLAESKFNMNDQPTLSIPTSMKGGAKPKKLSGGNDKTKPKLLLFHAKWCGHCVHFMPTFLKLKHEYTNLDKLDVISIDEGQKGGKELVAEYGIQGFPTIKLYDGNKIHDYNGGRDINNIRDFVNSTLKTDAIKG